MRISLHWLNDYVDCTASPEDLAHRLTMAGLEIEAMERPGAGISQVYVGRILSVDPHPNADRLVVCRTDIGRGEPLQIVCGARNMKAGDLVPTAVEGATLPGGFRIERRRMRGWESHGMMCSARELGLGDDHEGLLILDSDLPVGADAVGLLGLDDVIFEVAVTPNRGDLASVVGVAREVAVLFNTSWRLPAVALREQGPPAADLSSVTIDEPELCPRYIGRVLTGVKLGPSPEWLCRRLHAAGQRPINNVVDITNYVLMETGHPLHAFDYHRLAGNRIVVRRARPGETIRTIDGQDRALTPEMLVIADAACPVAVAGVMGGQESEVGEGTTTVFLESAYFNPVSVRRTSRTLGLQTEASQRFQRGADPEMALCALNRAAALMQDLCGAQVAPGAIDAYPRPVSFPQVSLRFSRARTLLGAEVPDDNQVDSLQRLGFTAVARAKDQVTVQVPSWRPDVTQEADLIEEVARVWGYERIPVALPQVRPAERVLAPEEADIRALRATLTSLGLTELVHWTFGSAADVRKVGLDGAYLDLVLLQNPLSENHAGMRTTLLPALAETASSNLARGVTDIAAFELGPVYRNAPDALPSQELRLGVFLTGAAGPKHWSRPQESLDFYDLKGIAETVLERFAAVAQYEPSEGRTFQPGHAATILLDGKPLGVLGLLSPDVHKAYDLSQPVYALELALQPLLDRGRPVPRFQEAPRFPPSLRDLAVVVDRGIPAATLRETARAAGGKLLRRVDIFDVYTGKQVDADKKSVALGLVFQSDERTLTDQDTQKAFDNILRALTEAHGAALR